MQTHVVPNSLLATSMNSVLGAPSILRESGSTVFASLNTPPTGVETSLRFLMVGSPYKSETGFDADSLTKQLSDLAEQGRKIVGWTILTEEDRGSAEVR